MKFEIGEVVTITNSDLLNDGTEYENAVGVEGEVRRYDSIDDTYQLILKSGFDCFKNKELAWVHEDNLVLFQPYFTPVVDEHRKHPDVDLIYPKMGSEDAIACDFYSPVDVVIKPNKYVKIYTDFKAIFPRKLALLLNVRSSMGDDQIMLVNTQGWFENDYANNPKNDGNIIVGLYNFGEEDYVIKQGDRIAQGMFVEVHRAKGTETNNKRVGGHGSTGK